MSENDQVAPSTPARQDWSDGPAVIRFLIARGGVAPGSRTMWSSLEETYAACAYSGAVQIPVDRFEQLTVGWGGFLSNTRYLRVYGAPYRRVSEDMWKAILGEWIRVAPHYFADDDYSTVLDVLEEMQNTWANDMAHPPQKPFGPDLAPRWGTSRYTEQLYYDHYLDRQSGRLKVKVRVVDRIDALGSSIILEVTML